jgi:hypothetical protein
MDSISVESLREHGTRPAYDKVIRAIIKAVNEAWGDGACNEVLAALTLTWLTHWVKMSRRHHYRWMMLKRHEMDSMEYRHFNLMFPHGQSAAPDSAADLINRYLLNPAKGEVCIMHSDPQPDGDCYGIRVQAHGHAHPSVA